MERAVGRQDFVASLVVSEFSGQFVKSFVCFRAAVAKKAASRRDQPNECFREQCLRFCEIKVRDMEELPRLLEQRVGDFRIRMTEGADRDAAAEIEVAFSGDIVNVAPFAVVESQIETGVGWNHVPLK